MPLSDRNRCAVIVTYDLDTQPWSVGDVVVFHQAARCLWPRYEFRFRYTGAKAPDNFPNVSRDHPLWAWVWGAARAFENDGVTESREGSEWPADTSSYLYYRLWDILAGSLPHLPRLVPVEREWAKAFHREHGTRGVIHVRDHPYNPNQRNSNIPAWRSLVRQIEPVVAIGDVGLQGAVSAREFSVEKQFALIATSEWYMGASSGPGIVAQFSGVPNRIFSNNVPATPHKCWTDDRFVFGDSMWFSGTETPDLLLYQYEELCRATQH